MFGHLDHLAPRPADPLLGITAAFNADPRPEKMDLGVGVYRDDSGVTPIFAAVKAAEQHITETQPSKAYEGPRGNGEFCAAIETFIYGERGGALGEGRTTSCTTPGGCGALFLGINLGGRMAGEGRVWVSDPSWPNHVNVAQASGREAVAYPYLDARSGTVNFPAMMDALRQAKPGDVIILQGPCHNPSGVDLTNDQWAYLGEFCASQRLIPLLDIAYHGFGDGLEADMDGVKRFLAGAGDALMAYSCSKNFGLYRERTGCLVVQATTQSGAMTAGSHLAEIARAVYSMPPAHGAAIVSTILADDALRTSWQTELESMRQRMVGLRTDLAAALNAATGSNAFAPLAEQKGMFSLLPLQGPVTEMIRVQGAVYMPGSGRINIAGLSSDKIQPLAERLAPFLKVTLAASDGI